MNLNCDTAKELLTLLSNCNNTFLSKLPKGLIRELSDIAADSSKEYNINPEIPLEEQLISSECLKLMEKLLDYVDNLEINSENKIDYSEYQK